MISEDIRRAAVAHITGGPVWIWLTSAQKSLWQDGDWTQPCSFPLQSPHGSLALPSSHLGSVHAPSSGSQLDTYHNGCLEIVRAEWFSLYISVQTRSLQNGYFGTLPIVGKSWAKVWNGKAVSCCTRNSPQILSFPSGFWAKSCICHTTNKRQCRIWI